MKVVGSKFRYQTYNSLHSVGLHVRSCLPVIASRLESIRVRQYHKGSVRDIESLRVVKEKK